MIDRRQSYTAADILPAKVVQQQHLFADGKLRPIHIQLNPTNRCNRTCQFCSCSARDKHLELPLAEVRDMFAVFRELGSKAVTITGGGEPLLHPHINEIIESAKENGIDVGLVSNGDVINRLNSDWPMWLRISCSDEEPVTDKWLDKIEATMPVAAGATWAFSYVLTRRPDWDNLRKILTFAVSHNMSHVRIVSDLLDLDGVPEMDVVRRELGELGEDPHIIYQGRKQFVAGDKRCLTSLVKPSIAASGLVYPCCGAQYAPKEPLLDYNGPMGMGHWREFPRRIAEQDWFDGSQCYRCYYHHYNTLLELSVAKLEHGNFI
jgi:MoaA/NifB/PqqE/SkfB family radical SAM enzyme